MAGELTRADSGYDVGPHLSFHYSEMMSLGKKHGQGVVSLIAASVWTGAFCPAVDIPTIFFGDIPLRLALNIVQLGFLIYYLAVLLPIRGHMKRWEKLEATGPRWIRSNDQNFRVLYYQCDPYKMILDPYSRDQRIAQERDARHQREQTFRKNGYRVLIGAIFVIGIPGTAAVIRATVNLGNYEFLTWIPLWTAVALWIFWMALAEPLAVLFLTALDELTYRDKSQFIPGAVVTDEWIQPKSIEMLRAEETQGRAGFEKPQVAAQKMKERG